MTMFEENLAATQGIKKGLIVAKAPHLSSSVYEPENYYSSNFELLEENSPAAKTKPELGACTSGLGSFFTNELHVLGVVLRTITHESRK